jgi:hypothetical protein
MCQFVKSKMSKCIHTCILICIHVACHLFSCTLPHPTSFVFVLVSVKVTYYGLDQVCHFSLGRSPRCCTLICPLSRLLPPPPPSPSPTHNKSQVQRQMSAKSLDDAKWAIVLNGIVRFPLTLVYCMLGVSLLSFAEERGCYPGDDDDRNASCDLEPDDLVPEFIAEKLGSGFRGK